MRILGRKFYAYKSKNRRKNTPDSAFPRTLGHWLKIRSGHGIFIYSAGQGLTTVEQYIQAEQDLWCLFMAIVSLCYKAKCRNFYILH